MKNKIIWATVIMIIVVINYIGYKIYMNMHEQTENKKDSDIVNNIETVEGNNIILSIGVSEFKKELEKGDKIVIDIRTQEELDKFGTITEDVLHIDIYKPNFSSELGKLDMSKKYLIYCYHGNRTKTALNIMENKGFEYVKDLNGGTDARINMGEEMFKF